VFHREIMSRTAWPHACADAGLQKEDRVALFRAEHPAAPSAHYAVPDAGCVLRHKMTRLNSEEVYILERSKDTVTGS